MRKNLLSEVVKYAPSKTVKEILEDGNSLVNEPDENGRTPLMWACSDYCVDKITYLLEAGALPNIKDNNGNVALSWLVLAKQTSLIKILLSYGADLSLVPKELIKILSE